MSGYRVHSISVNRGIEVEHLKNPLIRGTLMYSQLSMKREPTRDDCKYQGTHVTLDINSRFDDLKLME